MQDLLIFFNEENDTPLEKNLNFFENNYSDKIIYFHKWVEKLHDGGAFTYLEALVNFCDEHDIEYEKITKYISPALKEKIYKESVSLNVIKVNKDLNDYEQVL